MTGENIRNAKKLAARQYAKVVRTGNDGDCVGFHFAGRWVIDPWHSPDRQKKYTDEEAVSAYGSRLFETFCVAITREHNAGKVSGWMSDGHPQNW